MKIAAYTLIALSATTCLHWLFLFVPVMREWIAALLFIGAVIALGTALARPDARDRLRRGLAWAALILLAGGLLAWM
ncbi:MAG: hypothetical protein HC910_22105 [Spirulinaceae cyanobacterium SM2_1_0]|nr:hypothetical protein [Spirulinaceae cyanobacterium SM2_1_0]